MPESNGTKFKQPTVDLLLIEAQIISNKIEATVDRLWRLRNICLTFWLACVAVALGDKVETRSLALIMASCAIPVFFFLIDARYNRWYRKLASRNHAISSFINDQSTENLEMRFPLYDPGYFIMDSKQRAYRDRQESKWRFSLFRNLIDSTPLVFFGMQIAGSIVILVVYF
ncbi:hypothetical protein [Ruegeria sp. HKCCD6428]|uniref:hypothetical protein n=1 Tax=Ruegeria sp. HKCCD6428 TaxID=2683002 RepID=UPI0014911FB7|nr:hypothetical protein [Ruegeria sp. HKCCD6428]NOC83831.1 hypothetical protein [Ruegeria sp. HKCCD6428]